MQKAGASTSHRVRKHTSTAVLRSAEVMMKAGRAQPVARTASQNGGLKRVDMIAARFLGSTLD